MFGFYRIVRFEPDDTLFVFVLKESKLSRYGNSEIFGGCAFWRETRKALAKLLIPFLLSVRVDSVAMQLTAVQKGQNA